MSEAKKNLDIKNIGQIVLNLLAKVQKHIKVIFAILVALIYLFIVFRINLISSAAPTQEEIDAYLQEVKRPRIDKKAVEILKTLEDQNVQVQTLFQEARDNPFEE